MATKKEFLLIISVIILAVFLRFYNLKELAVFLADQASDSSAVLAMTRGQFTLLGPITSVGGFHNGPIVYYLMLPFYLFFKGAAISGTIFQSVLQILTIPVIFVLGKKIRNIETGLLASFLFAISPLMVDYSRAAFNSYPAIFFSSVILYLYLKTREKFSALVTLLLGISLGFILQMHYFSISIILLTIIAPLLLDKNIPKVKYYLSLLIGALIGFSPFILFEIRHQFLNSKLFWEYLGIEQGQNSIGYALEIWPNLIGRLLMGENTWGGVAIFVFTAIITIYLLKKQDLKNNYLQLLTLFFLIINVINIIYGHELQTHYLVVFHIPLIILFALALTLIFDKNKSALIGVAVILLLLNSHSYNLGKKTHPLQDGLSITDFEKAAEIIHNDKNGDFNVAMHAQGDNRAMPLRYTLNLLNETPRHYDNYSNVETLYFISRLSDPPKKQKMWEYTSFGKSKIVSTWALNDEYNLYKLNHF